MARSLTACVTLSYVKREEMKQGRVRRIDEHLESLRTTGQTPAGRKIIEDWRALYPWVLGAEKRAKAYYKAGGFPDFLTWREMHCAYLDERTGRWVRARNSWYQQDAMGHLQAKRRLIMVLAPGHIKALALDTPIATPDGFKTVGDIQPGDEVFDADGHITRVLGKSEVFTGKECFEVEFSSGEKIVASGDHRWLTRTRKPQGIQQVRTTSEMYRTQQAHGRPNHSVAVCGALQTKPAEQLPIDPYVFGLWLGDGSSSSSIIWAGDQDVLHVMSQLEASGYAGYPKRRRTAWAVRFSDAPKWSRQGPHTRLREMGVWRNKHIPQEYLWGSEDQRLALLQGLMDSDGTVGPSGAVFNNSNPDLADGVAQLVRSLGCKAKRYENRAKLNGKDAGANHIVLFWPSFRVFRLPRKQAKLRAARDGRRTRNVVRAVRPVPSVPTQCLAVDSPSHLFLAGTHMVPTHNTSMVCVERSVYDIMADRNVRLTVVQKNEGEASKLVRSVKERLGSHDFHHNIIEQMRAQGDVPIACPLCAWEGDAPFKPTRADDSGKWGAFSFVVAGRTSGEKDATMEAKGVGSQIQGIRASRIVLDDIQDPGTAMISPKDSTDKLEWLRAVILGRLFPHQQLVVLANFFTPDDFAHQLIEAQPDWPVVCYPALLEFNPDTGRDYDPPRPLCPEVWTLEGLIEKRKEVGEQRWHFTWMQETTDYDDAIFKRPLVEAARDYDMELGEVPPQVTHIFAGCDPAIVGFCAICIWGLDARTGQRYLIDIFNEPRMRTFSAIQAKLLDFARRYPLRSCAIELANNQESITNDDWFRKEMRGLGCKLVSYRTRTGMGARAEHDGFDISTIGGLFDAGKVTLPYAPSVQHNAKVDAYVDQLCAWRVDLAGNSVKRLVRDMVMATLFAESEAFPVAQRGPAPSRAYVSKAPKWVKDRWSKEKFASRRDKGSTRRAS